MEKTIGELREQKVLSRDEAAAYLGVGISTLQYIMSRPDFPPLIRIGRRVFIDREKFDGWIDAQAGK